MHASSTLAAELQQVPYNQYGLVVNKLTSATETLLNFEEMELYASDGLLCSPGSYFSEVIAVPGRNLHAIPVEVWVLSKVPFWNLFVLCWSQLLHRLSGWTDVICAGIHIQCNLSGVEIFSHRPTLHCRRRGILTCMCLMWQRTTY